MTTVRLPGGGERAARSCDRQCERRRSRPQTRDVARVVPEAIREPIDRMRESGRVPGDARRALDKARHNRRHLDRIPMVAAQIFDETGSDRSMLGHSSSGKSAQRATRSGVTIGARRGRRGQAVSR